MRTALAAALVNFLWQGALIGALAWIGFALARTPRVRYIVGVLALAAMAAAPIVTGVAFARAAAVPGPWSQVPGSLSFQVPGSVALEANPGRGTENGRAPGTGDEGPWTFLSVESLDPRLASLILAAWLLGVAGLSTRLTLGWLGARRLTREVVAAGADVKRLANQLVVSLGIRANVRVVESALVKIPAVVGAFKPVVLLPAAAMSGLSMEQVEALLAHELAHVRRHDYLVNLLQSAVETLLFYHPAVWLVSRRVRQERELCCDDLALEVCGDRVAYASALADLESLRALPSPALAATGGSLIARIRRILGGDEVNALTGRSRAIAGIAILAALVLLAGGQAARARGAQTIADVAKTIQPTGEQIFPATWPAGRGRAERSPAPPQGVGVRQGVVGGIVGGAKPGVVGGVVGGVQQGVVGSGTSGVVDGVTGGVPGGVQGGIVGRVQSGFQYQVPATGLQPHPNSKETEQLRLNVGAEVAVFVSSPVSQTEFSAQPYKVAGDGTIKLPHLDRPLQVVGLSIAEVREVIRKALIDAGQYSSPTVEVNLLVFVQKGPEPQISVDPRVYVFGEVRNPGAVDSSEPLMVMQAIALAGGQLRTAAMSRIKIIRIEWATGKRIELKAVKLTDPVLPGDTVILPEGLLDDSTTQATRTVSVTVQGAIRNPGKIELRDGQVTLASAIRAVGGLQLGAGKRIRVRSANGTERVFNADDVMLGRLSQVTVADGDTIVAEAAPHFYVTGAVVNPTSEYTWEEGMTLQRALALAGGLSPQGAGNRVSISRKDPKSGKFMDVKLDKDRMTTPILPDDVVKVPVKRM